MGNTTTNSTAVTDFLTPLSETASLTELTALFTIPIVLGVFAYTSKQSSVGLLGSAFLINLVATVVGFISPIPALFPITTLLLTALLFERLL